MQLPGKLVYMLPEGEIMLLRGGVKLPGLAAYVLPAG